MPKHIEAPTDEADEVYVRYMREVVDNEQRVYRERRDLVMQALDEQIQILTAPAAQPSRVQRLRENSRLISERVDNLKDAVNKLMHALERAPHPRHPSLQEHHAYWLRAMKKELERAWWLHRASVFGEAEAMRVATLYEEDAIRLLGSAIIAFDEYERSR